MCRVLFLVGLMFLHSFQEWKPQCLFCECHHAYVSEIEGYRQKPTFSGTKKVKRWDNVRNSEQIVSPDRCSLCMSCDHKVVGIKKCGCKRPRETMAYLCEQCLKNNMLPVSSYEILWDDYMSVFVCAQCDHDIGGHI